MSFPGNTPDKPDVILHIGAGICGELDRWLTTAAKRVVLVEPNPERVRALVANANDNKRVEVVQKAVAGKGGHRRLNLFNLPALSSLREPTGLLGLFPGLNTEREVELNAITPVELIEAAQLPPDSDHWLIIDTSGEEAAIIDALHAADQLTRFNWIILHCGTEPLYSDNRPATTLLNQLQEAGYDIEQQDDTDPDRPCWSLHLNAVRLENQALRQRIAQIEKQANELADMRNSAQTERDEHARIAQERGQEVKELTSGRDEAVVRADKASDESRQKTERIEVLEKALEERLAERDQSATLAAERQKHIAELEFKCRDFSNRYGQAHQEISRAEGQIELIQELLLRGERE